MEEEGESLFGHPEIQELFHELLANVVEESDRGAVLVGTSYVDQQLDRLFREIAPSDLGKDERKSLYDYPGPLSSFAARTEVAYATRLISRGLYESLRKLRRIRNEIAHKPTSFSLREQEQRIRQVYALGPGMPVGINRMAIDLLMYFKVQYALEMKDPIEGKPLFSSSQEVVRFISDSPDLIKALDEQLPRFELAVAVAVVCALLVWHREATCRLLEKNGTLSSLERRIGSSKEQSSNAPSAAEPSPAADV